MTKRDDLLALAERCEKASEGSRDLDARIACVQDNRSIYAVVDGNVLGLNSRPPHDMCVVGWAPSYTTSLDAAMTLVPGGYWPIFGIADGDQKPFAIIRHPDEGSMPNLKWGCWRASSIPLALCAAALRAQAEMEC